MSSIISKHYAIPEGCLEISANVIKRAELGLANNFFQQVETLKNDLEISQIKALNSYQSILDNKLADLEEQFGSRIVQTIDELKGQNEELFSAVEDVCATVCRDVLTKIGAEMSSQEKINILISDALRSIGNIKTCTLTLPPGCSIPKNIVGNTEHWTVKEDDTLQSSEMIINVDFGAIKGNFDTSFQKHIEGII